MGHTDSLLAGNTPVEPQESAVALIPRSSPIPPGGYHFIDRSGGAEARIEGGDFATVAQRTLEHRLRNGRPPGNPLQELYDYVCGNWRSLCDDTNPPEVAAPPGTKLAHRVSAWIGRFAALTAPGDNGVEQPVANARAGTCAGCPQNQNYRGGCPSCVSSIDQTSFSYRRGRTTPSDDRLGGCTVLGEHLPTSVWSAKLPATSEPVPDFCWRKSA
jgi:hypothetical protein